MFRRKLYTTLEAIQTDVDQWLKFYNYERPHSGRYCYGKTPWQTWKDSKALAKEKSLDNLFGVSDTTTQPTTLIA